MIKIPEDRLKRITVGDHITITGYKSNIYDYSNGHLKGKVDPEGAHLTIKTGSWVGPKFEVRLVNRTQLLALKEAVDFALEEETDATDETR